MLARAASIYRYFGTSHRSQKRLAGAALTDHGAGLGDVIDANNHPGVSRQIKEPDVDLGFGQPLHDHGQLARAIWHREHQHLELAGDRVAAGPERRTSSSRIPAEDVDNTVYLGDSLDVDARA